jgi:hypothetical protein
VAVAYPGIGCSEAPPDDPAWHHRVAILGDAVTDIFSRANNERYHPGRSNIFFTGRDLMVKKKRAHLVFALFSIAQFRITFNLLRAGKIIA